MLGRDIAGQGQAQLDKLLSSSLFAHNQPLLSPFPSVCLHFFPKPPWSLLFGPGPKHPITGLNQIVLPSIPGIPPWANASVGPSPREVTQELAWGTVGWHRSWGSPGKGQGRGFRGSSWVSGPPCPWSSVLLRVEPSTHNLPFTYTKVGGLHHPLSSHSLSQPRFTSWVGCPPPPPQAGGLVPLQVTFQGACRSVGLQLAEPHSPTPLDGSCRIRVNPAGVTLPLCPPFHLWRWAFYHLT